MLHRVSVSVWLAAFTIGFVLGHNTRFEGYDLSRSGYHLCVENQTIVTSSVEPYVTLYVQRRPCGGWLPWRTCEVTLYKVAYRSINVTTPREVIQCCPGYQQVGSYCALPLNSSAVFTAKPGNCPLAVPEPECNSTPRCRWDTDCPRWQKCCQASMGRYCTDPEPPAGQGWCFNVTVTVKVDFQQMAANNETGLLNHTRLLHSVVTGALNSSDVGVFHVESWCSSPFTTSSSLLIGSPSPLALPEVASRVQCLLRDIEEVAAVNVQDVDECAHVELNGCPPDCDCINTEGSYECRPRSAPPKTITTTPTSSTTAGATPEPTQNVTCAGVPQVVSVTPFNVTGSSFSLTWAVEPETPGDVTFQVLVLQGQTQVRNWTQTSQTQAEAQGLQPGVLYRVCVTPNTTTCGAGDMVEIRVKTEAKMLKAVSRLTNVEFTPSLLDSDSPEYKNLSLSIEAEILQSLPPDIQALVDSGLVRVVITGFSNGSVLVNFDLFFVGASESQDIMAVSESLMASLLNSSKYTVDANSSKVEDPDECHSGEMDCSPDADCVNIVGGYECVCKDGFEDTNPNRPGRSCRALPTQSPAVSTSTSTTVSFTTVTKSPTTTTVPPITTTIPLPTTPPATPLTTTTTATMPTTTATTPTTTATTPTTTATTPTTTATKAPTITTMPPTTPTMAPTITTMPPTTATMPSTTATMPSTTATKSPTITTMPPTTISKTSTTPNPTTTPTTIPTTPHTLPKKQSTTASTMTTTPSVSTMTTTPSATTTTTTPSATSASTPTTFAAPTALPTTQPSTQPSTTGTPTTTAETLSNNTTTTSTTPSPSLPHTTPLSSTTPHAMPITTQAKPPTTSPTTSTTTTTIATTPEVIVIIHSTTISVECNLGYMAVSVARSFLTEKRMAVEALYLGLSECGVNAENSTHVKLVAEWNGCSTQLIKNATHNIVQGMLYNSMELHTWPDGSQSVPSARLQVPILCTYSRNETISMGYSPNIYEMINGVVQGSGTFQVTVRLLNGSVPLPENYTLAADEMVMLEVSLNSSISQISVVLNRCWATESYNPSQQPQYTFLQNGCPVNEQDTTVLQNGNDTTALLKVKIFSIVDAKVDSIYLHCQIEICFRTGGDSCRPDCGEPRLALARLGNMVGTAKGSCGPFHRSPYYMMSESQQNELLWTIGFSILGVGLVLLVVGTVLGAFFYKRRVGTYDFNIRPRQEDFSYNIFSTS